ncbi:MAG: D-alanyl-D-alanine carboxypeptidase [bacterium]
MTRLLTALTLFSVFVVGCASQSGALRPERTSVGNTRAIAALAERAIIDSLESQGATVAIAISNMNGKNLFLHDASRLMVPVSVQKLGLTADVLLRLPPDYRWETRILASGPIEDGVLKGDLILLGGWDPSLSGDFPYSDWPWRRFDEAAKHLSEQGIQRIEGNLVGVGDLFTPGGWEAGDLIYRYAPVISQLMWNDGVVTSWAGMLGDTLTFGLWPDKRMWSEDFTAGRVRPLELPAESSWSPNPETPPEWLGDPLWPGMNKAGYLAVPDPRILAVDAFRISLRKAGIEGGDSTRVIKAEGFSVESFREILSLRSAPLDSVLKSMLAVSSNGWAEQIAATANSVIRGVRPAEPLWPEALDSLEVDPRGLRAVDACGMARANNLTAMTLLDLLIEAKNRWGDRWTGLFVKPGELYSTLEDRLEDVKDLVIAKTGSVSRNRSLAGYILQNGEPKLAFVVMVNNSPIQPNPFIDAFIAELALRCNGKE